MGNDRALQIGDPHLCVGCHQEHDRLSPCDHDAFWAHCDFPENDTPERRLDAEIAARVMGWRECHLAKPHGWSGIPSIDHPYCWPDGSDATGSSHRTLIPEYSTQMRWARLVLDKLTDFQCRDNTTIPLAICHLALQVAP